MTTEPAPRGFTLVHELDRSVRVRHGEVELARYVYRPWDAQYEAPRPYLHPLRTLGGAEVSLYRPHDHVWHKGIAWSLPNVGDQNFWGGPTYVRDRGYVQLDNNGTTVHRSFTALAAGPERVTLDERLDWVTQAGETWFTEERSLTFALAGDAWVLTFGTRFTNVSGADVAFGSPTTNGRPAAGYGGLFWRGPRSFTGGAAHVPGGPSAGEETFWEGRTGPGADELMGSRAPWLSFVGKHDGDGTASTLVFVDAPDNPGHPTRWFLRTVPYAVVCPAPFYDEEVPVAAGASLGYRYAVVVADGDHGDGAALAASGLTALV
jgi:hypothetical protein